MEFVAIDFETASSNSNSACQLAAVTVSDGEITHEQSWLIRPPRLYFAPRNIAVHGIRPSQVRDAPSMADIWEEVEALLDGNVILAHNARFDIGVLVSSLASHDIACPALQFSCTRAIAKGAWPGRSRYGLKPLGTWLGIDFKHHDALEDARCCAQIALAAASAAEQTNLEDLETKLKLSRGSYLGGTITSPRLKNRGKERPGGFGRQDSDRWGFPSATARKTKATVDPQTILDASADNLPLAGKKIFLFGGLRGLDLEQSKQLVMKLGGEIAPCIALDTHYAVACGTSLSDASRVVCQALSDANSDGTESQAGGVRILSERQFRALLPGGKAVF